MVMLVSKRIWDSSSTIRIVWDVTLHLLDLVVI